MTSPAFTPPQRICVIGTTSTGKSTLAQRLAAALDAPYVEMDALFWKPNWVSAPDEEFIPALRAATAGDAWVTAGNYRRQAGEAVWPRAQLMVWLDLPLHLVLWRVIRRSWQRSQRKEVLWGTNTETFWKHLKLWDQSESLIAFAVATHRSRRDRYTAMLTDPQWSHIRFVRLCTPREVEAFTRDFEAIAGTKRTA